MFEVINMAFPMIPTNGIYKFGYEKWGNILNLMTKSQMQKKNLVGIKMSSDHATRRCIYVVRNQSPFIAENIQTNYSSKNE